jgi:hypothetical protein
MVGAGQKSSSEPSVAQAWLRLAEQAEKLETADAEKSEEPQTDGSAITT